MCRTNTHPLSVPPREQLWQPISLKTDAINPAKAVSGDNYESCRNVWPVATHKTWRTQRDAPVDSHSSSGSPNYCVSSACWVMQNRDLPCRWSGPFLWICLSFLCPPRSPPLRFCRVWPGRCHTPHCHTNTNTALIRRSRHWSSTNIRDMLLRTAQILYYKVQARKTLFTNWNYTCLFWFHICM